MSTKQHVDKTFVVSFDVFSQVYTARRRMLCSATGKYSLVVGHLVSG